jgi:rare lipoprotein A
LLALLALAACGTAPTLSEPAPAPAHKPAAARPSVIKPETHGAAPGSALTLPPASSGRGGYYQDDGPGDNPPPNLADVPDADVRNDPLLPRSNRPYVVFGKTYTPITDNQPFTQIGVGSWYGKKFHGQRTSSGELYDMYKMTAAHPTLPIPSYARLTNLVSGAQVVVRINDRGPFHASRAIDVSYTAALKLGLLGKGSHELQIERILPDEIDRMLATRAGVSGSTPPRLASQSQTQPRLAQQGTQRGQPASATPLTQATPPLALTMSPSLSQPLVLAPQALPQGQPQQQAQPSDLGSGMAVPAGSIRATPDIEALMLADRAPAESGSLLPVNADAPGLTNSGSAGNGGAPAVRGGFYLQLGAYSRAENAEAVRVKLARSGGDAGGGYALEVVQGGPVYRLFAGPYASRQEALQAAQGLPAALGVKPIVIQR